MNVVDITPSSYKKLLFRLLGCSCEKRKKIEETKLTSDKFKKKQENGLERKENKKKEKCWSHNKW